MVNGVKTKASNKIVPLPTPGFNASPPHPHIQRVVTRRVDRHAAAVAEHYGVASTVFPAEANVARGIPLLGLTLSFELRLPRRSGLRLGARRLLPNINLYSRCREDEWKKEKHTRKHARKQAKSRCQSDVMNIYQAPINSTQANTTLTKTKTYQHKNIYSYSSTRIRIYYYKQKQKHSANKTRNVGKTKKRSQKKRKPKTNRILGRTKKNARAVEKRSGH